MIKLRIKKVNILLLIYLFTLSIYATTLTKYVKPTIPVLTKGKWTGYNSIYTHNNFDALLDKNGIISVFLKSKEGIYLNKKYPIVFPYFGLSFYVKSTKTGGARRKLKYTKFPIPSVNPRKRIEIEGITEGNVTFYYKIEFKGTIIQMAFSYKDSSDTLIPTSDSYARIYIPRSYDISNNVGQKRRIKILRGSKLITRQKVFDTRRSKFKSKTIVYPYYNILSFKGKVEKANIVALSWKPRKITITPDKSTSMSGSVYENFCPWEGFTFPFRAKKWGGSFTIKIKID